MTLLSGPGAALAWLGRRGTTALAVSLFIGIAMPSVAAYVKPYLAETVFVLLLFSYLRTDPAALRKVLKAPRQVLIASAWIMVGAPLIFGTAYALMDLREHLPVLYTIMVLQAAISPITSAAAFAALIGLDVAFSLLALIICNTLAPITTVAISYLFLGTSLFSPLELGGKLMIFFVASGMVAYAIRGIAGQRWIDEKKDIIDGLNVITAFVFALAAMESVSRQVMADPLFALMLLGIVCAVALSMMALSILVFMRAGIDIGLAIGLLAGLRNLGVIMAALGSTMPDAVWLYFALAQFPVYLFPALVKPLVGRRPRSV